MGEEMQEYPKPAGHCPPWRGECTPQVGDGELAPGSVQPQPTESDARVCPAILVPNSESGSSQGAVGSSPRVLATPPPSPSVPGLQEGSLLGAARESAALNGVWLWAKLLRSTPEAPSLPSYCPYRSWGGGEGC